jgi:membrane-bound lytic murein transglycosylase D
VDERLEFGAATDAALTYLARLHQLFQSWPLALAAYNAGEGRVQKAIAVQGVNNYYHLSLPEETERYVYRILAAKIILEDPTRYGFDIPSDQLYPPLKYDEVPLTLAQPVPVRRLAEASGTYYKVIKTLNPWIKGDILAPGTFRLKIPFGSAPRFQAAMRPGEPAANPAGGTKK